MLENDEYLKVKRCIDNIMHGEYYSNMLTEKEYYLIMSFIRASHMTVVGSRKFISSCDSGKYYYSEGDCFNLRTKYKPFNTRLEKILRNDGCLKITKFRNQYADYELSYRDFIWLITDNRVNLSSGTCTKEEMEDYFDKIGSSYTEVPIESFINKKINNSKYITRSDIEYKQWINSVLERDNYTCQCCGSKLNPEVHHILNYSQYKNLRVDIDNGTTLCECCHSPMIKGSFHNTYGTRNNTKEQLQEYVERKQKELNKSQ